MNKTCEKLTWDLRQYHSTPFTSARHQCNCNNWTAQEQVLWIYTAK